MGKENREGLSKSEFKQLKKDRIELFLKRGVYEIEDLEIEKTQINESQWRLFIGKETVDIFPKGQKFFHLNRQNWGIYADLEELIKCFKKLT